MLGNVSYSKEELSYFMLSDLAYHNTLNKPHKSNQNNQSSQEGGLTVLGPFNQETQMLYLFDGVWWVHIVVGEYVQRRF